MVDFDEGSDVFQMVTIRLYSTPVANVVLKQKSEHEKIFAALFISIMWLYFQIKQNSQRGKNKERNWEQDF